nr:immunoglobulin light chain junction region [Macaca mulatta]MOX76764.1 immunoglobulin light chain junction region [Macaca mulatta]
DYYCAIWHGSASLIL